MRNANEVGRWLAAGRAAGAAGAAVLALAAAPGVARGQMCTSIMCSVEAVKPTCAALPAEGHLETEYLTIAAGCSCCTGQGTATSCAPDDRVMPALAVFSGSTKLGGTFKPAGKRCKLVPAYTLDRLLEPGTYTVKATAAQGMPGVMVKVIEDPDSGCAVARRGRSAAAGLVVPALAVAALALARRRRGSRSA